MPRPLPKLDLTHGQVLWTLSLGMTPPQRVIDQLRYLRQLGVPFAKSELGLGRGYRLRYDYFRLVEAGVALYAVRRGLDSQDVTSYLISERRMLRRFYRAALLEQSEGALAANWVKSRSQKIPVRLRSERFLRLPDRWTEPAQKSGLLNLADLKELRKLSVLAERLPGETARTLVPLTRLVLEWMA